MSMYQGAGLLVVHVVGSVANVPARLRRRN